MGPRERIVLAVETSRVLGRRALSLRVDPLSRDLLALARCLDFQRVTLGWRTGTELGLRHVEFPRTNSRIARLSGHAPDLLSNKNHSESHYDSESQHAPS